MKSQAIRTVKRAARAGTTRKQVYIGMSGGVDSSVSAALLLRAGYEVTGVFIKVWQPEWLECTWREERRDAMRVAAHLGIPFITLDLEKEYKKEVVDYMITEYSTGRTPNPDVMCNKHVKFGGFYDWALREGADFVATGHYAQIIKNEEHRNVLSTSADQNKDQSYFLWTLKTGQLDRVLFPIGHLLKSEVRKLAKQFRLPTADKKDSQGLCFIGMVDMKEFLSHYIETTPGDVLNENNEVIGRHPGALLFTIGERHGFTITKKSPHDMPAYVVAKDASKNTITVQASTGEASTAKVDREVRLTETNWIGPLPTIGKKYQARSRYRQQVHTVTLCGLGENQAAVLYEYAEPVAAGQSLVLYDGNVCVGGGVIV